MIETRTSNPPDYRKEPAMKPQNNGLLCGRKLEFFHHDALPEWGYTAPQQDTFAVLHPQDEIPGKAYPLYVVFHSAGHDVYSTIACCWQKGNHDIYHTPADMFGLYLDCRANTGDWWWGGINAHGDGDPSRSGTSRQPVENRCIAAIEWMMEHYPIDRDRVYAVGNSMGGSGALGIALCRGDIFAAIKANVPAGVRHAADRCCLDTPIPEGFSIPDPPVTVDYSAQNDGWSDGHEILYRGMRDHRYPLIGFWGAFGHANNNEVIAKENDLIHSLDLFAIRKSEAYPVFTDASTDDPIPWPDRRDSTAAGQVNGFFRWKVEEDSADRFVLTLRLLKPSEWETRVTLPESAEADVLIRRLQNFRLMPGDKYRWSFAGESAEAAADETGHPAPGRLRITQIPQTLILTKS